LFRELYNNALLTAYTASNDRMVMNKQSELSMDAVIPYFISMSGNTEETHENPQSASRYSKTRDVPYMTRGINSWFI